MYMASPHEYIVTKAGPLIINCTMYGRTVNNHAIQLAMPIVKDLTVQ